MDPNRSVRIVTGARGDRHADPVSFEFLRAREARQRKLGFGERQRTGGWIGDHIRNHAADKFGFARMLFAQFGMVRHDVPHLVGEHRSELRVVIGQCDQAARDIKLPARQREGINGLRIKHGDFVVQIGPLRCGDEAFDRPLDQCLQSRLVVDAAVGGENTLMLTQHVRRQRRFGCPSRERSRGLLRGIGG